MATSEFLKQFLDQPEFIKDLKAFFELPPERRAQIRKLAPLDKDDVAQYIKSHVSEAAEELSLDENVAFSAAMVSFVLRSAVAIEDDVEELLSELTDILGEQVDQERDLLVDFLQPNAEEQWYLNVRKAFSEPPTYKSFSLKKVQLPSPDRSGEMLPGYWVDVKFYDDVDSTKSARFFCTEREMRTISRRIDAALSSNESSGGE